MSLVSSWTVAENGEKVLPSCSRAGSSGQLLGEHSCKSMRSQVSWNWRTVEIKVSCTAYAYVLIATVHVSLFLLTDTKKHSLSIVSAFTVLLSELLLGSHSCKENSMGIVLVCAPPWPRSSTLFWYPVTASQSEDQLHSKWEVPSGSDKPKPFVHYEAVGV